LRPSASTSRARYDSGGSFECAADGSRGSPANPILAGQHTDYLIKQLIVFQRTEERPEGAIMKVIAHDLTPDNIKAIASYLESLPAK